MISKATPILMFDGYGWAIVSWNMMKNSMSNSTALENGLTFCIKWVFLFDCFSMLGFPFFFSSLPHFLLLRWLHDLIGFTLILTFYLPIVPHPSRSASLSFGLFHRYTYACVHKRILYRYQLCMRFLFLFVAAFIWNQNLFFAVVVHNFNALIPIQMQLDNATQYAGM